MINSVPFHQISNLAAICISTFIAMFTLSLNRNALIRYKASGFIPIILLHLVVFLITNAYNSALDLKYYIILPETLLVLYLQFTYQTKDKDRFIKAAIVPAVVMLVVILTLQNNILTTFSNMITFVAIIFNAFLFILISIRRIHTSSKQYLYYGLLLLNLTCIIGLFIIPFMMILMVLFKVIGYICIFMAFYYQTLHQLMNTIKESERVLSDFDKSVEKEIRSRTATLEQHNQKLIEMTKMDKLSHTFNKAAILNIMEDLISEKSHSEFTIIMFDIDHFKLINDKHGHVIGDKCIKEISSITKNSVRPTDYIGRYGGDEFIIVLPGLNTQESFFIAERLKKNVQNTVSPHFTISMGIATYPYDAKDYKNLISAADEALYLSKQQGRNTYSHKAYNILKR